MRKRCDEEGQHCEMNTRKADRCKHSSCRRNAGVGPMRIAVLRRLKQRGPDGEIVSLKSVCQFSFSYDLFRCRDGLKYCASPDGGNDWALNVKLLQSTDFDPSLQTKGHDCKRWFMIAQKGISGFIGLQATVQHTHHVSSCSGIQDSGFYNNTMKISGVDAPARKSSSGQCPKPLQQVESKSGY